MHVLKTKNQHATTHHPTEKKPMGIHMQQIWCNRGWINNYLAFSLPLYLRMHDCYIILIKIITQWMCTYVLYSRSFMHNKIKHACIIILYAWTQVICKYNVTSIHFSNKFLSSVSRSYISTNDRCMQKWSTSYQHVHVAYRYMYILVHVRAQITLANCKMLSS